MLGWETCKYYYETDELPNPRPTQPKKNMSNVAFGPLFPTANTFPWVGIGFIQETVYRKPNPTTILRQHPNVIQTITTTTRGLDFVTPAESAHRKAV